MSVLDDHWKQVSDSDQYKKLDPQGRETVRQNFYRHFVVSSKAYQDMPEDRRYAIRQDFDTRTKEPPEPSLIDKAKAAIPEVKRFAKIESQMLPTEIDLLNQTVPGRVRKAISDIPIPGAEKVSKGLHNVAEFVSRPGAIAPPETSSPEVRNKLTNFQVARIEAAGFASLPWEALSQAVPKDVGSLAGYIALDKALEVFGETSLARKVIWGKPKAPIPEIGARVPPPDSPFAKSVMKTILEEQGREGQSGPPSPMEKAAQDAEKNRYEQWLADNTHPTGVDQDIHSNPKVNRSQLEEHQRNVREEVQKRIQAIQQEPDHLASLKFEEDALNGYYRDKTGRLVILGQPGPAVPKQALLGTRPEVPLLEGPAPDVPVAAPTTAPEAAPPPPTPQEALKTKDLKNYMMQKLFERHPRETRQTLNAMAGTMFKNFTEQGLDKAPNLQQLVDMVVDEGHADHLTAEEATRTSREVPGGGSKAERSVLSREEAARLKAQGIAKEDVLAEAKRLHEEWNYRNLEPEGHKYLREQIGGIRPENPDVSGKVPLQEEFNRHVKGSLRGSRPIDQAAQEMYEQGFTEGPSSADLLKYLQDNEHTTGKPRSVKSFVSEAIHNLEAPLTPPDDFSLESMKARPHQPVEGPVDNTQRSIFDIGKEIGEHFLKNERGEIGPGRPIDPVEMARMDENVKELVRRARAIGYKTTDEILLYAARNAPKEYAKFFSDQITSKSISPWDTHAYKEIEAAENGNKVAQKSIKDRAWYDYLLERMGQGTYKARALSRQLARLKDGDEMMMKIKFMFFKNDVLRESKIPKIEREALRFYMEKDVPDVEKLRKFRPKDAEEIVRLANNPTPAMVEAAKQIRPYEDEWWHLFSEHYDDVGYVQDYAMRRWKRGEEYVSWQNQSTGGKTPYLKGRKLSSAAEGINAGFEPVSFDIRDDLQAESDMRTSLLSKLHTLKKVALSLDDKMNPSLVIDDKHPPMPGTVGASKRQITPFAMDPPPGFLRSDHPLLRGLAFNPDYKPLMDYMFKARSTGIPLKMIEGLNALSKKSIFAYSLFHPWAIGEMLTAGSSVREMLTLNPDKNVIWKTIGGITRAATENVSDQATWKDPIRSARMFYDSFMEGHATLANRRMALDAAEHSLTFGAIDDVQRDVFNRTLVNMEGWLESHKGAPIAQGIKILRGANEIFDKALWDYWAPMVKMTLYENHLNDNIKAFGDKMPIDDIKTQTATFINKAVGGQAWGDLLASPKAQQVLQWTMLAPDWTIGRVLMGTAAATTGPQGRQARKLLARGFLTFFVFGNIMNRINSEKYGLTDKNGKPGRWMWDNDPGREMDIVWGKEGDRTTYLTPSKAFTELYDDIFHPIDTARHKVSPVVNMAAGALTGYGAGGIPIKGPVDMASRMMVPLTARDGNVFATFPKHKGMNAFQAEQLFEDYERTGNEKSYDKALQFSIENGLNWQGLHQHAKTVVHSERKKENMRDDAGHLFR